MSLLIRATMPRRLLHIIGTPAQDERRLRPCEFSVRDRSDPNAAPAVIIACRVKFITRPVLDTCPLVRETVGATPRLRWEPLVSQAFCSALPVAYSRVPSSYWEPFASLILQAAYEATMWAAVLNAQRGASNVVLLTYLGGGAFGNDNNWIHAAMRRALQMMLGFDLDVKLVSYGTPSEAILQMAADCD